MINHNFSASAVALVIGISAGLCSAERRQS